MNLYELTIVLSGKATAAKKKTSQEKLEKILQGLKGKITKTDDWGEVELSHKVAKNSSGIFLHFNLELESKFTQTLNQKLKMEDDIIRYLIVRKESSASA